MGIRSFGSYIEEYKEFYEGVLELAKMENEFSRGKEATLEEARKYSHQLKSILSQCPPGTNIEDLIGLVVMGESKK